jgi:hypothetical protein
MKPMSDERRRAMHYFMAHPRVSPARIIGLKSVSKNDQRGLRSFIKDYKTDDLTIALLNRHDFRTTHLLDDKSPSIEKQAGIYGQGRVYKSEPFKPYIGVDIDQPQWQETFKHEFGHYVHDLTEPKTFNAAPEKVKEDYAETYRKLITKQRKKEGTAVCYDVSPLYDSSAYERIRQSNPDRKALVDKAVKEFPLTEDFLEAGYILPDGRMLDFSGKHEGGTPRLRSYDHREVSRVFDAPEGMGVNGTAAMNVFEDYGALRFSAYKNSGISFDLNEGQKLSDAQRKRLVQASYLHPQDLHVTFYDKEGEVVGEFNRKHFFKSDISKIERAAEEAYKKRASPRKDKTWMDEAVKRFGTTEDFRRVGWILPDGRMLDFYEDNARPLWHKLDHWRLGESQEARLIKEGVNVANEDELNSWCINNGALRFALGEERAYLEYSDKGMTPAQKERVRGALRRHPSVNALDVIKITATGGISESKEIKNPDSSISLRGVKP